MGCYILCPVHPDGCVFVESFLIKNAFYLNTDNLDKQKHEDKVLFIIHSGKFIWNILELLLVPKARAWPLNISHERLVAAALWSLAKWLTHFGQNN